MDFPGNSYPNIENYAEGSFPQPIPPPDTDPDEPDLIYVAYSPEWTKVLMAAVDQLGLYSTWQGDRDAKILAVNRAQLLKWQLQFPIEIAETEYPTPYWDDGTDVDDSLPIEEQDWYGEVTNPAAPADELTFVENAVIWLFTGFVAIAAAPTLPGAAAAAIFFRTTAVRFTLAFNRGDVRELFRVVIDAVDYGEVDTIDLEYGDIVEIAVDGLEDLSEHDILLMRIE